MGGGGGGGGGLPAYDLSGPATVLGMKFETKFLVGFLGRSIQIFGSLEHGKTQCHKKLFLDGMCCIRS